MTHSTDLHPPAKHFPRTTSSMTHFIRQEDLSSFSTAAKQAHGVVIASSSLALSLSWHRQQGAWLFSRWHPFTDAAYSGMGIIIEHRYYGTSFPEADLIPSEGL